MKFFIAPRSGEKSYSNFQSSIKHGVPYSRIEKYLSPEGKSILSEQEVIYAWGNREAKKKAWERMEVGDVILFYAHYFFVVAGRLVYKQQNSDLALAMWPPDENGNPWEYTFFMNDLQYFKIPLAYFNQISGYNFVSVQGFQEVESSHVQQILRHYSSFDKLFDQFKDETSVEIPQESEPINVNVKKEITPEYIADFTLIPFVPSPVSPVPKEGKKVVDFEEQHKKNSKTGSLGEEIVLKNEKNFLTSIGRQDLADKVKRISLENVSAGYDIVSYDKNGNEKLIEVKSSVLPKKKQFSFNISKNEKRVSENRDNYYIYLVFDVNGSNPKIVTIKNPLKLPGLLSIEPTQFLVKGMSE